MARTILANGNLIAGDAPPRRATVIVEDDLIVDVMDASPPGEAGDQVFDLGGKTIMPGMILGHFHAAYHDLGSVPAPFGLEATPALHALRAAKHFRMALDSGFTGVIGAGIAYGIDAAMKLAIAEGTQVGPRIMAGGHNVGTTGYSSDNGFPSHWQIGARGGVLRCDGPEEFRRGVRQEIKDGVEIIKLFLTGGHGSRPPATQWEMSRDELAMAVSTATERGAKVRAHVTAADAILHAIEIGVHIVDHGDGLDELCIERAVERGTFIAPSLLFPYALLRAAPGTSYAEAMREPFERLAAILPRANAAGVNLILGDDHGAKGLPHGDYAAELELYVKEVGIAPLDVIRWATRNGAMAMGLGDKCGTIAPGKFADLLVVDGDPLADIGILRDHSKLLLIMKGGAAHKNALDDLPARSGARSGEAAR